MEEFSIVRSNKALSDHIPKGTEGTVVMIYSEGEYEVEFVDEKGETLGILTVKEEDISLVK